MKYTVSLLEYSQAFQQEEIRQTVIIKRNWSQCIVAVYFTSKQLFRSPKAAMGKRKIQDGILQGHNIHTCCLPPNTTDYLQPMNISANKPAKDFIKMEFET